MDINFKEIELENTNGLCNECSVKEVEYCCTMCGNQICYECYATSDGDCFICGSYMVEVEEEEDNNDTA